MIHQLIYLCSKESRKLSATALSPVYQVFPHTRQNFSTISADRANEFSVVSKYIYGIIGELCFFSVNTVNKMNMNLMLILALISIDQLPEGGMPWIRFSHRNGY